MNISQLTIASMSGNVSTGNVSEKSSDVQVEGTQTDDFKVILSDLMGQTVTNSATSPGDIAGQVNSNDCVQSKLQALLDSAGSIPGALGKNIISLASMLLGESQSTDDQKTLLSMLNSILQQINSMDGSSVNLLSKLIAQIQTPGSEGLLLDKLRDALSSLPDSLKLKLQDNENGDLNDSISTQEAAMIQSALLPALSAITVLEPAASMQKACDSLSSQTAQFATIPTGSAIESKNDALPNVFRQTVPDIQGEEISGVDPVDVQVKDQVSSEAPNNTEVSDQLAEVGSMASEVLLPENVDTKSMSGTVTQNTKSSSDGSENGKTATSTVLSLEATAKGNSSDDAPSADSKNSQSKNGAATTQDVPSPAAHAENSSQVQFAQTMEKTGSQNSEVHFESVAQVANPGQGFVETDKLLSRIVSKLDILLTEGRSEARIKLKPEFLGELKIHLIMDGGSMKAVLNVSTSQAKGLIEANLGVLKQSLESQGLQLKEFEVTVDQQQNNQNQQNQSPYRQRHFGRSFGNMDDVSPVMANELTRAKTNDMLNGSMAVNYLA